MGELFKAKVLALRVAAQENEPPVLTGDELTTVLEELVRDFLQSFRELQVQTLMAATSQRAKFEYEMLQHHPHLEVLILRTQSADTYVLFTLPLLGDQSSWDPKRLVETDDPAEVFVPDGFSTPNFAVATDSLTISIGFPVDDDVNEELWPLVMKWPQGMKLSSQVTHTPSSSKSQSSVELITLCKQMFLQQWTIRKDFIAELRRHVIVLEYNPVDFSQVFFMLQEQLDERSPLRIMVLRLQFTPTFFLTNCTSDLQLSMLDGEENADLVNISLPASSASMPNATGQKRAVQFVEATRKSLLRHLYG